MAGEEADIVGTKVKLDDLASTPLGRIGQSFDEVSKKAGRAQAAAAGFSKLSRAQPTGYAAAAKAWGVSPAMLAGGRVPEKVRRAAEQPAGGDGEGDRFAQIRAENRARRARVRGLRLEEQRGDILEGAMGSLAGAVGANGNIFMRLGGAAESIGFQMAAFNDRLGGVGAKLVRLGGDAGVLGATFGIAYAAMTALDEAFGSLSKQLGFSGRSLTDLIAGMPDPQETSQRNEQYARALGFATVQHLNDASALSQKVLAERHLHEQIQFYARALPVVPAERTGKAMEAAEIAAMNLAKQITPVGGDIRQAYEMVVAAGENTAASWRRNADRQADFDAMVEKASKSILAYAAPIDASAAQVKEFNERIKTLTDGAVANAGLSLDQVPAFIEALKQKIESVGTVTNVLMTMQKTVEEAENVNNAMRGMRLPMRRAGESFELLQLRVLRDVQQRASREGWTPELAKSVAEKQFAKIDMQKAHLNVDFRNSRFDIKQNFAEGFDPDRIAVAFTQDLVALGDRRLQSAHAPVFSSR